MASGKFITLEGGEGAGKSTQARLLAERLRTVGHGVVETREPGGTKRGEKIRDLLLSGDAKQYGQMGEAVLFCAARDDHVRDVIRPALERGDWVICDRFSDSTVAYQGAAGGVRPTLIRALNRVAVGNTRPDLTLILDLPPEAGLKRAQARNEGKAKSDGDDEADRFEGMEQRFHEALRDGFLKIAAKAPDRCVVIDAQQAESAVAERIWDAVVERLNP
ncbi:MAG: dTMP kinase [Hyphomicrobiaceae bacterium]|nr:dTMP kinase [Hyphomicrobiaceae bacterium]